MISYVVILALPLVLSLAFLFAVKGEFRAQMARSNGAALQRTASDTQAVLNSLFSTLFRLSESSSIQRLYSIRQPYDHLRGAVQSAYLVCRPVQWLRASALRRGAGLQRGVPHSKENLSNTLVADAMGISPSYLSRMFKQNMSADFLDYISNLRVQRACELFLSEPETSAKVVRDQMGYRNLTPLMRVFKKHTGLTPGQYKLQAANAPKDNLRLVDDLKDSPCPGE